MNNGFWWATTAVLLAVMGAFGVHAGSLEDPEITDAADDSASPVAGQDVAAFWIDDQPVLSPAETPEMSLRFNLLFAGDYEHTPAFFAASVRYRVSFLPSIGLPDGAVEGYVHISPSRANLATPVTAVPGGGGEVVSCRFGAPSTEGESLPIAAELPLAGEVVSGTHMACYLPLTALPGLGNGTSIGNLLVQQQLVQRGPLSGDPPTGGDQIGVNVLETFDIAPDEGFGREYITGGATAVTVVEETLSGVEANVNLSFDEATTVLHAYAWETTEGNLTFRHVANLTSGQVAVRILDATNSSVLDLMDASVANDGLPVTGVPGGWRIEVSFTEFNGTFTFSLAPTAIGTGVAPEVPEEEVAEPTVAADPETLADPQDAARPDAGAPAEEAKGTAGFPVSLAGAAVALAASTRRR